MTRNTKLSLIIGGIAIVLLIVLPVTLGSNIGWQMGCWSPWGTTGMMGGFTLGWLIPLLWISFIALIIWLIISLVRGPGKTRSATASAGKQNTPIEILESRYASGEISKREFVAKKKTLLK